MASPPQMSATAKSGFVASTVFKENGLFGGLPEGRWRLLPTEANAAPAFGLYQRQPDGSYQGTGVSVLEVADGQVTGQISFLDLRLPEKFGLPATLPAAGKQ